MQTINLTIKNQVAYVVLNRPEKKNAISFAMLRALVDTAKTIRADRSLRAVIIHGSNGVLTTGIDLQDLNSPKQRLSGLWQLVKPGLSLFQNAFLVWQRLPVPVIVVMEGYCLGAGMQLALAADFRVSTPDCKCGILEAKWGLVPDMGLSHSLKGLVRQDIAKELTYTAKIFSGQEAAAYGLVSYVSAEPLARAEQLVAELIERSPDAIAASKAVLNAMELKPSKALRLEKLWQLKLLAGKNSAIARAKDKKPERNFKPRQYN